LPNAVTTGNGTKTDKTAAWTIERAKMKDAGEFAMQLGVLLEAGCAADGVKFTPVNPPRLAAIPFKNLTAGPVGAKAALPDAAKISAAVKFVPYALQVTRALDLSGESGGESSQAQLIGAIVLPRELAPQRWGEVKLQEVVDGKGASLLPEREDKMERMMRMSRHWSNRDTGDEDEGEDGDGKPAVKTPTAELRRVVTLEFLPPDWKVKEIARIKGAVTLQYMGEAHVIKLANTIPLGTIKDTDSDTDGTGFEIRDPKLTELGMSIAVPHMMAQAGMTMLMLKVEGQKALLTDVQVFDVDGHPWPTIYQPQGMMGEDMCQVMVPGKPPGPLSLALLVNAVGASVEAPILVEHVSVGAK
jgi:hypothetical protein